MFHAIRQSRRYAFVMVAVAAMLVTGALWRQDVDVATATTVIDASVVPLVGDQLAADASIPIHDETTIASPTNIMRALTDHPLLRSVSNTLDPDADRLVAELQRGLSVTTMPGSNLHDRQITIRYRGAAPAGLPAGEFAMAIVESLAQQYVDAHQGRGENGRLAQLDSARSQKRHAQQALDAAQIAVRNARDSARKIAAEQQAASKTARRRNPQWLNIHKQLLTLTRERDELFEHATEQHPELELYENHIAKMSRELALTPQWIELQGVPQRVPTNSTTELSDALAKHERIHGTQRAAETGLNRARRELEQSVANERSAYEAALGGAQLEVRWHAPYETIQQVAKRTPQGAISLAVLFALAGGGLTAICVGRSQGGFRSVRHVRRLLAVPVLAVMPGDDGKFHEPAFRRWSSLGRAIKFGSEATLVAFLVATIVCLTADPSFAGEMASEPFAALSSSVERAVSAIGR